MEYNTMDESLIKVGEYNVYFNKLLGIDIHIKDIFRSKGLPSHMINHKHGNCLKYIDYISEIIEAPDYIGINPNEKNGESFELIKRYKDNVLIGIKINKDGDYLYVSTMHDIQESKIQRRLHSGRLKEFTIDNNDDV